VQLDAAHPLVSGQTTDSRLVNNLRGERTSPLPVWFMRQAGRSLPEYRALRKRFGMLESCLTPDVAAEITLQPVRRHRVDAAIFFSDIVVPLRLAGVPIDIVAGVGPVLENPVTSIDDLTPWSTHGGEALTPIRETISHLVSELGKTPLIGFGGAPFTLASYLIEGGPSKDLPRSREMMVQNPDAWEAILTWCADITAEFITAQVRSGASALQVFDSWAGKLSPDEYRRYAAPYTKHLFNQLKSLVEPSGLEVPRIHFGLGTGKILPDMVAVGATALGVDFHTPLAEANAALGGAVPLQGNIDPGILLLPWAEIEHHVRGVVESGSGSPGHVVNLGHGVPKDTPPEVLTRIVELVHEVSV
jgi:uroporphyrinogen decarboxylase